ncbi:uncharacterized protein LOC108914458, partial [Anoplophora glabripennis]|uniref:uncharacterized protein LOC108914458 n=1 Tax=Anoplophora glabripennis TaxID=217634 RepID=UPI000874EA33
MDLLMATDFPTENNASNNEPTMLTLKNPRATVTTTSLQTNSQSSSTTTRVSKSSTSSTSTQRVHVTSDLKASNMKSDLVDFKNNLNDMKSSISNSIDLKKLRSSLENLVDADDEMNDISQPLVTFPDDTPVPSEISTPTNPLDTLKFEQKTMNNFKKTKVVKDGFSTEKESANCAEMKKLQAGDVSYEANSAAAATRARLEIDGISAEKSQLTAKGHTIPTNFIILPDAENTSTLLGIDFIEDAKIVLDISNKIWHFTDTADIKNKLPFEVLPNCQKIEISSFDNLRSDEGTMLIDEQRNRLNALLEENQDIFEMGGEPTPYAEHYINTGDHPPISTPPYRMTTAKKSN